MHLESRQDEFSFQSDLNGFVELQSHIALQMTNLTNVAYIHRSSLFTFIAKYANKYLISLRV